MCTIEQFHVVFPDGRREQRQRVVNCPRGTRTRPCSNAEVVTLFEEQPAREQDLRPVGASEFRIATPRGSEGSRSRSSNKRKPKSLFDDLALTFRYWKPFSKKPKKKLYLVRDKVRSRNDTPAIVHHYPRAPTPPPPLPTAPRMPEARSPNIVPIAPNQRHHSPSPQRPKHQRRPPPKRGERVTVVHGRSSSSEDDSPSPPPADRDHKRKSRSISPRSRAEYEKQRNKEKERRRYAERVAREEDRAHKRAVRVAELERLEKKKADQERIEHEERRRLETAEKAKRRQQQEEFQRVQAKRRQELEDIEAFNAAERVERRRKEQDRIRREEHRIEEEDRLARARRANVPRQPRHRLTVHHPSESMEDRGERFIREAIRQENLRQFERGSPPNANRPHRAYDDGDLRRRNTFGGGRRRDRRSD